MRTGDREYDLRVDEQFDRASLPWYSPLWESNTRQVADLIGSQANDDGTFDNILAFWYDDNPPNPEERLPCLELGSLADEICDRLARGEDEMPRKVFDRVEALLSFAREDEQAGRGHLFTWLTQWYLGPCFFENFLAFTHNHIVGGDSRTAESLRSGLMQIVGDVTKHVMERNGRHQ